MYLSRGLGTRCQRSKETVQLSVRARLCLRYCLFMVPATVTSWHALLESVLGITLGLHVKCVECSLNDVWCRARLLSNGPEEPVELDNLKQPVSWYVFLHATPPTHRCDSSQRDTTRIRRWLEQLWDTDGALTQVP